MLAYRDLKNNLVEKIALPLAVYTGDQATPTGVDMILGDGICAVVAYVGTNTATATITVEESDDNSTFTAVVLDNSVTMTFGASDSDTIVRASFQRSKRYIRTPVDFGGSISSGLLILVQEMKKVV